LNLQIIWSIVVLYVLMTNLIIPIYDECFVSYMYGKAIGMMDYLIGL